MSANTKPTKADLERRISELEAELAAANESLDAEKLNGEAIMECRVVLAEIGYKRTYFDDCVTAAAHEIKRLRYDTERYRRIVQGMWTIEHPETTKQLKPKRDGSEPQAWMATVSLAT